MQNLDSWFATRGWSVFPFQREVWDAMVRGESGLLHCATGAGKTLAVWGGALLRDAAVAGSGSGLRILWITPLRALAANTEVALNEPLEEIGWNGKIGRWTGDTSQSRKSTMRNRPPAALISTPESTSLLLSQPDFLPNFASLHTVIIDEWHELLSTKRGVLAELILARIRSLAPMASIWGLSATLGNIPIAAAALGGWEAQGPKPMRVVQGRVERQTVISSLLPPAGERYPWAGHLGLKLLPMVVEKLRKSGTAIIFTNTRSQTEIWFQALLEAMPDWEDQLGLHHGSLDSTTRDEIEQGLAGGRLRAVVATSSLDLGVDFAPVDLVLQIGSPKGVARLLQRAGRSGHRPGAAAEICCVPTNTFELAEIAAVRELVARREIEARLPLNQPLDVLVQHILSTAAGSGFSESSFLREIRSTHAYRELTDSAWHWTLAFAAQGGKSLAAYPAFKRLEKDGENWTFPQSPLLLRHRLSIGTITADAAVQVRYLRGKVLGSVEESFVARLKPGDRFLFGGRILELVRLRDQQALVRASGKRKAAVGTPRWMGGKMPLSTCLGQGVREVLADSARGIFSSGEMQRLRPILDIQQRLSAIPRRGELLIELITSREGQHVFVFPFEGRLVHEGLAALFAYRLGVRTARTFTLAVNDYGFEILSAQTFEFPDALSLLLEETSLTEDILGSINASEMMRRRFREIARIAGLTFDGFPGRTKKAGRPMQVSSSLLFEVFSRYEPDNLLLGQARREVLEGELEEMRMRAALKRMRESRHLIKHPARPTPLAFPLMVERLREQLSTEALAARLARMQQEMQNLAGS